MKAIRILLIFVLFSSPVFPLEAGTPWEHNPPLGSPIDWGHPLAKGLIGCWLMNETQGHIIRNLAGGEPGIISGAVWQKDDKQSSLSFNGTGSTNFVAIGKMPHLTTKRGTVATWVKMPSNSGGRIIFYGANVTGGNGLGGQNEMHFWTDGTQPIQMFMNGGVSFAGTTDIDDSLWHFVACTWDAATVKLFVDGEEEASVANNANDFACSASTYIARSDTGARGGLGNYTNFMVYNRTLSPDQIKQLFRAPYAFIKSPDPSYTSAVAAGVIKTLNGLAWASVKTVNGLAVGSVKTINGAAAQ